MTDIDIDRDLVGNPPRNIVSGAYARLFEAHVKQSLRHFASALPSGGLRSLFSRKDGLDAPKLSNDFESAYRTLLMDTLITLSDGTSLDHDPDATTIRPVLVFSTESRDLIVPERFVSPVRRTICKGSSRDAETIAACFPFELIATIDRVLRDTNLAAEQRKKVCEDTCFAVAMDFDDGVLGERFESQAAAPILCCSSGDEKLVLLPSAAAQHEYVHGNLDEYFGSQSS